MAQRSEHEMAALLRDALQPEVLDEQQLIRQNNLLKTAFQGRVLPQKQMFCC